MTIQPVRFSAFPSPRFSGRDEAPPPPPPTPNLGLPETRGGSHPRRSRAQRIVITLGSLLAAASFITGGVKAVDAMMDDGDFFSASVAERDHIREETNDPLLALGWFGGIFLTVAGFAGGKNDGDKKKPGKKPG